MKSPKSIPQNPTNFSEALYIVRKHLRKSLKGKIPKYTKSEKQVLNHAISIVFKSNGGKMFPKEQAMKIVTQIDKNISKPHVYHSHTYRLAQLVLTTKWKKPEPKPLCQQKSKEFKPNPEWLPKNQQGRQHGVGMYSGFAYRV